jgi:hypothetical protein
MGTSHSFARTPTRPSTGCGHGTCRGRGCRRRARTESRTPARPWSRASRTPSKERQRPALPRCNRGCGRGAYRSGSQRGLVHVGGVRLAWADSLCRDCGREAGQMPGGGTPGASASRPNGRQGQRSIHRQRDLLDLDATRVPAAGRHTRQSAEGDEPALARQLLSLRKITPVRG